VAEVAVAYLAAFGLIFGWRLVLRLLDRGGG
jgi:hypothetical protein